MDMLRLYRLLLIACTAVVLPFGASAQDSLGLPIGTSIIEDLRAVQVGENVQLDWFIPEGLSCIDMQVQRIDPNADFRTQHTVFGICGSDDSDSFYDFTDTDPLLPNRTYGWRIYASNGTVVSDTVFIDFIGNSNTLQVGPNPLTGTGYAWFNNASSERVRLEWWDAQGRMVRSGGYATESRFALDRSGLEAGSFLLVLRNEEGLFMTQSWVVLP